MKIQNWLGVQKGIEGPKSLLSPTEWLWQILPLKLIPDFSGAWGIFIEENHQNE